MVYDKSVESMLDECNCKAFNIRKQKWPQNKFAAGIKISYLNRKHLPNFPDPNNLRVENLQKKKIDYSCCFKSELHHLRGHLEGFHSLLKIFKIERHVIVH